MGLRVEAAMGVEGRECGGGSGGGGVDRGGWERRVRAISRRYIGDEARMPYGAMRGLGT